MFKKLLPLLLIPFGVLSAQETIKQVKTFTVGASLNDAPHMIATDNYLLFAANNDAANQGNELWISDGTTAGTKLLKNLNNFSSLHSGNPRWFNHALGKVIFVAEGASLGEAPKTKLYITDGTESGTIALCDLSYNVPGTVSVTSSAFFGKELNGKFYFSAETDAEEAEIWVTDGTPAGTKILKDIYATTNFGSFPRNFEVLNNKLFFTAKTPEHGEELWISDGTEAGTTLVKDIYPGNKGYVTGQLVAFKGKLYFAAGDKDSGKGLELWVSDGTAAGTVLFKDINVAQFNSDSYPQDFYVFNDKLYFNAYTSQTGYELFVTDGTAEGTKLVHDLNPGSSNGAGDSFVAVGNTLFFPAKDATYGNELFKLSANGESIEIVKDINTLAGGYTGVNGTFFGDSRYKHMGRVAYGNKLIFTACDNDKSYNQVWITDGTNAGTKKLTLNNVPGSSNAGFTIFKNEVYFWGNYYSKVELYKISGLVSGVDDAKMNQNHYPVYQQNKNLIIENLEPNAKVTIYSLNGQVVAGIRQQEQNKLLQFSGLKTGFYLVKIQSGNDIQTQKISFN